MASNGGASERRGWEAEAARLVRSARNRDGFIGPADIERAGFGRHHISRMVRSGLIERVAPGWYRSTALQWSFEARQRQAAIIAERSDGGLGLHSALHWQGFGDRPPKVQLIVPRGRRPEVGKRKLTTSTDLMPSDFRRHKALMVTTATRSLIDAARHLQADELHELISDTVRAGLATDDDIALRFLELTKRGRPTGPLRLVLSTRSDWIGPEVNSYERRFEGIVDAGRFPRPLRQYRVVCDGHVYYLDYTWLDFLRWSECDSMLAHSSQEALARDHERQNRVIETTGMVPLRFTYRDVNERPDYVDERLARHLPRVG